MIIPRPQIEPIPTSVWSPPRFRLTADYIIVLDDGLPIILPKGFETDGASVPRLFWSVPGLSPTGQLIQAAPFHDGGYQYGYLLSFYEPGKRTYPESSMALRERYPRHFGDLIPVFVGRNQEFFDQLLAGITIDATGQRGIALFARAALYLFGGIAWGEYRSNGPAAHNTNSLYLPGVTLSGFQF